ncbi:MAG TPA: TonB-dependent receptor [Planctomycetota bacterium]|nr:TonB-dependent receptor [Planctomycetota bacterium]
MNLLLALLLALQDPASPPAPPQEKSAPSPEKKTPPKEDDKEVVIIGQRRESDILDVPSGVTVVTSEDIQKSGATNIVEVVQKQAGFFAAGTNKGAYDQIVDIRGYNNGGGNGQRILVLVDGRRTNTVSGNFTDWASIPVVNISRIEIVRGPAAAMYGDGALAGVVNIITKKGGEGNAASASGGNWGTYQAAVNVGGDAKGTLYDVFGSLDGTRGWREHSKYAGDDLTGRVDLPLNDTLQGYLKVGHHNDRRQEPGSLSLAQIATFGPRYSDSTRIGDTNVQEDYADLGLTQALGDVGTLSLFLDHTHRDQSTVDFANQVGTFETSDQSEMTMLQLKHVVRSKVFQVDTAFTTGIDLSYETADATSGPPDTPLDWSSYQRRLVGAYEQVEVRPVSVLVLSGGARFDRALLMLNRQIAPGGQAASFGETSADRLRPFDEFSPMAGVTFKILEELSAYTSWGKTFKLPTRDELVGFFATDPTLYAEKATTYETGLRYWEKGWGGAAVTLYHMRVHNELFFDDASFSEINLPTVVHQGAETELHLSPLPWVDVFGMYDYTTVTIKKAVSPSQDGKTYPVTPKNAASAGVSLKYEGAALTLSGRYAGERFLTNDLDNVQPELPGYWVWDAKASYTWKALTVFVSVFNLADRKYFDNGGAGLFGAPARFLPGPERSWLAGGEVRF